jgi:hypothetical protein
MDPRDHDFYRVAVRPGTMLRVVLTNRSSTLAPEITLYDENKSQVARRYNTTPGANASVEARVGRTETWYVRVSATSSVGQYTLKVEQ